MKKRLFKIFSIFTLVLMIGALASCSKKGNAQDEPASPSIGDPSYPYDSSELKAAESGPLINGNKIIYQEELNFSSEDPKALEREIRAKVLELGGFVVSSNESANVDSSFYRANAIYKIPADRLNEFETHIDGKEELTYRNKTSQNVEGTYVTHQATLETLEAKLAIYQSMYDESAGKPSEQLNILDRMDDIQLQIAQERKFLDLMDSQIDYSTIQVSYSGKNVTQGTSVWEEYGSYLLVFLEIVLLILLYSLPFLAIAGVTVVIIVCTKKKKLNKHQ